MSITVFVDGQEGTTGLRIHDYLARRSDVEVLRIDADRRKDPAERKRCLNAADVAFLCLPEAASREAVAWVDNPRTCVIDASTAHRVAPGWIYGLPELAPGQRAALRGTRRIANPGCHATAFLLLVRPLVDAGVLPADHPISATSITGYSGGGRKMIEEYESSERHAKRALASSMRQTEVDVLAAPRPYGLTLAHKHIPEMTAHAGLHVRPIFLPIVGDFYRGLSVSLPLHLGALGTTARALHQALQERYVDERFVRVMPLHDAATLESGFFDAQGCNGTNRADLFVFGGQDQALLMARLDNLGKGASGAAVQAMNVHLGVDEGLGL